MQQNKEQLYRAVVVTAETVGTELSRAAAEAMTDHLSGYPLELVYEALARCKAEVTGRLSLHAILSRINNGHVGVEEAWGLCPQSEDETVVWTDEIAEAFELAKRLLDIDPVGARMAFKECYARIRLEGKSATTKARWWPSMGHDPALRVAKLQQAVELGRLRLHEALAHVHPGLPGYERLERLAALIQVTHSLPAPVPRDERRPAPPEEAAGLIAGVLNTLKRGEL